jgi:hypothetical protein
VEYVFLKAVTVIEPQQQQRIAGQQCNAVRGAAHPSGENAMQEESRAVPTKTARQTKPPARAIASDPMGEAEARIAEAHQLNATELNLSYLRLTELPESFVHLSKLRKLKLNGNHFRERPKEIWQLEGLRELELANNKIDKLSEKIGPLKNLQVLDLGSIRVPGSYVSNSSSNACNNALPRRLTW